MAPPSEPEIDTEELMARVRATLAPSDAAQDVGTASPVVLSPHFHQEQLLLDQAQRVASVGANVPPFGGLNRLLRPLAKLTTRTLYFLLQVVTVDQRVFNNLLLNVARMTSAGLAQGEAALNERLNERLNQWRDLLAGRDRQIEALASAVGELHAALAERERRLTALERRLEDAHAALAEGHAATAEGLAGAHSALTQQSTRLAAIEAGAGIAERAAREAEQRAKERFERGDGALAELRKKLAAAQTSIAAQERRLVRLAEEASPIERDGAAVARALASEAAHALDALYVDFEEGFRGSAEDIKERLGVYLPDVQAVVGDSGGQVLDLGCGRGEWLSLLRERGIAGRGIDANRVQIERCRSEGLEVVEGDAIEVLATISDASIDVVTAFHLIEHLGYAVVIELLDHVVRVLRPGGLLILETPNPDNVLVGSCQFYLDPTHRHPLPSPLAKFLAEARGLHDVEVRPLHPAPDYEHLHGSDIAERLNRHFYGPRDYAVLGYKA